MELVVILLITYLAFFEPYISLIKLISVRNNAATSFSVFFFSFFLFFFLVDPRLFLITDLNKIIKIN